MSQASGLSLGLVISKLLFSASAFGAAQPTPKGQSNGAAPTYTLKSDIEGLGVLRDGILGAGPGAPQKGRMGWNEITLSAPGHASRRIRFFLEAGSPSVELAVSLVKSKSDAKFPALKFKRVPLTALDKKASICLGYMGKVDDKFTCDRRSLTDDFLFSDDSVFRRSDLETLRQQNQLLPYRQMVAKVGSELAADTAAIEAFYAAYPELPGATHLASLHALLRGDCPRVASIAADAWKSLGEFQPSILHAAVCAETQNQGAVETQLLALIPEKERTPALMHWTFQQQLLSDEAKALKTAEACYKAAPKDVRCRKAMLMAAKIQGKAYKLQGIDLEELTFKLFMAIEEQQKKGGNFEGPFLQAAAGHQDYPLAAEFLMFMDWIDNTENKESKPSQYAAMKMKVAEFLGGTTADKTIEAIEKRGQTNLLPPIYLRRLRFAPEEPNLWFRLIRSYSKAGQCEDMLKAVKQGEAYLPKYNATLLQMRGSCEIEMNRLAEALKTYLKIIEVNPNAWSSPYNVANVYERMGKKADAVVYFKRTLEKNPPEQTREAVEAKVMQLGGK